MMAGMADAADMTSDRWEGGALARTRARECGVTDPEHVIRVTFDQAPTFHYDDGRPPYELPPLGPERTDTG